jgi:hypothetical protein
MYERLDPAAWDRRFAEPLMTGSTRTWSVTTICRSSLKEEALESDHRHSSPLAIFAPY